MFLEPLIFNRFNWGFGDPNRTAALIAMLLLVIWAAVLEVKRRWAACLLVSFSLPLLVLLVLTQSRAGLLALGIGLGILLIGRGTIVKNRRVIVTAMLLSVVAFGFALWSGAADRYFKNPLTDASVTNRFVIWSQLPRILVDAPGGWGWGNAGPAFSNWYQPLGRNEVYASLVSSHFTFLAELSWPGRIGYIFGWALLFIWLSFGASGRRRTLALALWCAFFVASSFSSVAHDWRLWIVPGAALIAYGIRETAERRIPPFSSWFAAAGIAGLVLGGVVVAGARMDVAVPVKKNGQIVTVGQGQRLCLIYRPSIDVLGRQYGHGVRRMVAQHAAKHGPSAHAIAVVNALEAIEPATEHLALISGLDGAASRDFIERIRCRNLVLADPRGDPEEYVSRLSKDCQLTVLLGEFSDSRRRLAWQAVASRSPGVAVHIVPGAETYLASWPAHLESLL